LTFGLIAALIVSMFCRI